ncbi:P-loop containing nucleoside triphosphate hydrolase protein [Testicularia cyperi]|uniref:P-loop containing nucleoside triphosphate hydrolase protein n=1 Tax=Testicularia cyperi TaxID=1882483 RepID=A0A317XTM4_9BASI|nr:P-loop containing nucleoside triphosphate hydrolase protein [Testicularia cyperi]
MSTTTVKAHWIPRKLLEMQQETAATAALPAAVSTAPQPTATLRSTTSEVEPAEQYLVVLSGLIGSGKSTFARALVDQYPNWTRCNQDELGDRHAVEAAARQALLNGKNVLIDRTNIDAKQRRTWLDLAASLNQAGMVRVVTVSLTLSISSTEAQARLDRRTDHETIKSPQHAAEILRHFLKAYQKTTAEEGFNYVLSAPATTLALYPTQVQIDAVLFQALATTPRAPGVLPAAPPRKYYGPTRGRGRGGFRGRGASAVYAPHHRSEGHPVQGLDTSSAAWQTGQSAPEAPQVPGPPPSAPFVSTPAEPQASDFPRVQASLDQSASTSAQLNAS